MDDLLLVATATQASAIIASLMPFVSTPILASLMLLCLQKLYVNNTMHGQKGLIMRLRVAFSLEGGQRVEEQAEVSNFPPGL